MVQISNEENNHISEEVSLRELILKIQKEVRFISSKWLIILLAGIIGGILGIAYSLSKKTIYKAELSFALQDEKSGGGLSGALGLASQFGLDVGGSAGGQFSGDNLLELMKSRSMIEKALLTPVIINNKKETLAELYIDFNNIRSEWESNPNLKNIFFLADKDRSGFTLKQDSVLGSFNDAIVANNLTVGKLDKKLSIITLNVKSKNELFSKYFAEVLAKVVSDFYVQTKTKKGIQNVSILQRQTDSVRLALNTAISGVASSLDATPNANPSLQIIRVPSQRRQVDVAANTAILGELVKNLEVAKMSLLQETPLIQIIDKPILPLPKDRPSKLLNLIAGGIIGMFLMIIIIFVRRFFRQIMSNTI